MTFGTGCGMISLVLRRTAKDNKICASGSVGGARPCQGRGRGFESRLALFSCKGISVRISLFCMKWALRGSNRIQKIQFEVSEDLKSSSVGANHWSPGPIAPSRAFLYKGISVRISFFCMKKARNGINVVCSIFLVTTLWIVVFLLYYYEYEKNRWCSMDVKCFCFIERSLNAE